jgi:hypothetical protein
MKKTYTAVLTIEVTVTVDENENWCLDEIDQMIGDALEAGEKAMDREVTFDFATSTISYK